MIMKAMVKSWRRLKGKSRVLMMMMMMSGGTGEVEISKVSPSRASAQV